MWQEIKNAYHLCQAFLANILFGFPGRKLKILGITGTDGKTTTATLIYQILQQAGKKSALITSIGAVFEGKKYDTGFHVTTPSSFSLQKYLQKAVQTKTEYVVLEVTSHALDQNRVWGIEFLIGVLTNITSEHLDYHKSFTRYALTKAKLLLASKTAILNKDDKSYTLLRPLFAKNKRVLTYSLQETHDAEEKILSSAKIPGEFNKYNILAAVTVARQLGIKDTDIMAAVSSFKLPEGRVEKVYDKDFTVIVDFAHTPNSIKEILSAIKPLIKKNGRLIHVFGSAGERDKYKRPLMGKEAARFADLIYLTSEDPRSEDPLEIIQQISDGIPEDFQKKKQVFYEINRQKAIEKAILNTKQNDVVVITGKGHEKSMNMGQGEMSWSDHEAVKKALQKRKL